MLRSMVGFHQDEHGEWVAELDCLHTQHVRHQPPFQERPWVVSDAGRAERIGAQLDCPRCDRAELPDGLIQVRTAGPFDETTVPAGLRRAHRVPVGTWGCLNLLEGSAIISIAATPPIERRLHAGDRQPIPPQVDHHLSISEPVRLQLDFLMPG